MNIAVGRPSLERATLNDCATPNQEPSAAPAAEPASTAPATSSAPAASQSGQSAVSPSSSEAKKSAYVAPASLPTQEGPRGLRFDYNEGCRIAAPEGDVFVANADNHTVEEFSPAGVLVRTLSIGINGPSSVATDVAGDVFVVNVGNKTVEELFPAGAFLRKMSSGISEPESVTNSDANNGTTNTLTIEHYASGCQLPHPS